MKKIKIELMIEKGEDELWGSVNYNNNLIAEFGKSIPDLEQKLKKLLNDFEGIDPDQAEFIPLFDV